DESPKSSEAYDSPLKLPSIQSIDLDDSAVEAFLSFGPQTPATADSDLAEERHLHELALQFEPSPVIAVQATKTRAFTDALAQKLLVHPASSPGSSKCEDADSSSPTKSNAADLSEVAELREKAEKLR
ncbi:hypothetical protein HPB47_002139, partial [Ixodes persulcatus]